MNIKVDSNLLPIASKVDSGLVKIGSGLNVDSGLISLDTNSTKPGSVKIQNIVNLTINGTLQIYTAPTSGYIHVGNSDSIDVDVLVYLDGVDSSSAVSAVCGNGPGANRVINLPIRKNGVVGFVTTDKTKSVTIRFAEFIYDVGSQP